MKRLLIGVLTTAAPLLLWLIWRRARLDVSKKRPKGFPITSAHGADKAAPAVASSPNSSPLAQTEEGCGKAARQKREDGPQTSLPARVSAGSQSESVPTSQLNDKFCLVDGASRSKLIEEEQAGANRQFSLGQLNNVRFLPSTEGSPEHKTAHLTRHSQSPEKVILGIATISTPNTGLQVDHEVPETNIGGIAVRSAKEELVQTRSIVEQEEPLRMEESTSQDTEKAALRYRPPAQKPPRQTTAGPVNQGVERAVRSEAALEIRVRLIFDRFGFCSIWLLPERTSELDDEVAVKYRGNSLRLVAQEDWYQDLQFENVGDLLRQGLELKGLLADHRHVRWLLRGRDIYVLASHQRASGVVSTARLALGRSHLVLCIIESLQQVEAILNDAGCEGYTRLEESHGVPAGWVGLRDVSPTKAIHLVSGSDPFYAIKPALDIELELEGGVCLRNSVWLAGYPPQIKLFGQPNDAVKVLIDGKQAKHTVDGFLVVAGYDTAGQHFVYCEGLSCSRSYSIEEPPDSWRVWPAYHLSHADVCGPLVLLKPEAANRWIFSVPMSNPLLLGAEPGQIFRCPSRSVARWKGLVPFDVVWALPAHPLLCDKKTARILQFANKPVVPHKNSTRPELAWSNAILDAARKGLRVENESPDSAVRWSNYKKAARRIWRAAR